VPRKYLYSFAKENQEIANCKYYTNTQQHPAPPKCFFPTPRAKFIKFETNWKTT